MFDEAARTAIAAIAATIEVAPAALLAVAETESAGVTGSLVEGAMEPIIRWEGHYFYRALSGAARARAESEGLAAPSAGAIKNPASQAGRYALLARARQIDEDAALGSCSWGLGQVMGAHWKSLGYASVAELVAEARSGAAGQVALMARFIGANGLDKALRRCDWAAFANRYNGPSYKTNRYDEKMAQAYARWVAAGFGTAETAPAPKPKLLKSGATGPEVVRLQQALTDAGFAVSPDGQFGSNTETAVRAFQEARGLKVDGKAGADTWAALG